MLNVYNLISIIYKVMIKRYFLFPLLLLAGMGIYAQQAGTFTDPRDGKTYKTVTIGTQRWFAENLAFKPSSGNYWMPANNPDSLAKYGYLYDWETAKNACPSSGGWHLPTADEFMVLISYLGGDKEAGGKLKATTGWADPNAGATNESGFTALPGGMQELYGVTTGMGKYCDWWLVTETDAAQAKDVGIRYNNKDVAIFDNDKRSGYYVRCIANK